MSGPVTARPAICLNMIVRNEAHIVAEVLDSVAPYISYWVIVDTGSDDGTQAVIRDHLAALGIRGELHERPWRNFGHNRSEALTLAQGHGDYIWVIDADDVVVGSPDFTGLDADIYFMRIGESSFTYWRPQLFRDGLPVRYLGVVHEFVRCEVAHTEGRLAGDYCIDSRRLGARSRDTDKYARDRDLLLAEVQRDPADARSVFYLAQSYFDLGDFAQARTWYQRRIELGGWAEEVYYSMTRVAESMARMGAPWPDVQDAYLRAWAFRPTRAESLYAIAHHYRVEQSYQLGYLFAEQTARIPLPEDDRLFVNADVYVWRAADEQAVCAFWIGKHAEAFTLCRELLAHTEIPDHERQRIAGNRDFSVPAMIEAASSYPQTVVAGLAAGARSADAEVTVTLIAGTDRATAEATLNSFLHCCTDIGRVGRFLAFDTGLCSDDRKILRQRYGFVEFVGVESDAPLGQLRSHVHGRLWLHLGQGWRFFAPEDYITRLTAVLDAEPDVFEVGINFEDATTLTGATATEQSTRRAADAGRYVLTDAPFVGPAMFDTARFDRAGTDGLNTASLDEVLCIAAGQQE
ncbi:MAG TPA: glycosyltransferase [Mycobacterium sp.]|nr:glycosyltransferase [Mycobacterium sp.]